MKQRATRASIVARDHVVRAQSWHPGLELINRNQAKRVVTESRCGGAVLWADASLRNVPYSVPSLLINVPNSNIKRINQPSLTVVSLYPNR